METCAVTTDGWTEQYTSTSYNGTTIHYIDAGFELRSAVLGTRQMAVSHTAANILEETSRVLEEYLPGWKERGVVSAFVTDNAANMKKAFEDHTRLSCACHNLNLVVGHALGATALRDPAYAALARQIAVCKSLVSLVKRKGLNHLLEKSLKQQVETRWNSLLTMIRSVLEALPELRSQERFAQSDVSDLVDQLSRSQLHALIDLLQPFEMASEQLSAASYSTLHLVVPAKERLMRSLSVKTEDTFAIKKLKEVLRRLLDEKFVLEDEHFVAAALWPPHRHFRGMQTVSKARVRQVHESLEEEVRHLRDRPPQVQEVSQTPLVPPAEPTPGPSSSSVSFFSFGEEDDTAAPKPCQDDVGEYLEDPGPMTCGGDITKVLQYWKTTGSRFPVLQRVARKLLAVPASSAPSERLFSAAGRTVEPRRTCLLPDTVDDILFLHAALRQ